MDITISPRLLHGDVTVIPSKSMAHRLLICSAFADKPTRLFCHSTSKDIQATAECLCALGASVLRDPKGYLVTPAVHIPQKADLYCQESGSTLRFLLPVVGALGVTATFHMEGRLPSRPLSPLWEEMERMGCILTRPTADTVLCQGKLRPGAYSIPGNISSQFISGLLFAFALMDGESSLTIRGKLESAPYVKMTYNALECFGGGLISPDSIEVEGDWSNGAFWLAACSLGSDITVTGLNDCSSQGDRTVSAILPQLMHGTPVISASDIPDLVPILSLVAACSNGAVFTDIQRLRLKESDRVSSVVTMLQNLGGKATASEDMLTVFGTGLTGGIVSSCNDHRIAMSAAIAATVCKNPVTILGAECVEKSYPDFWDVYRQLNGHITKICT